VRAQSLSCWSLFCRAYRQAVMAR